MIKKISQLNQKLIGNRNIHKSSGWNNLAYVSCLQKNKKIPLSTTNKLLIWLWNLILMSEIILQRVTMQFKTFSQLIEWCFHLLSYSWQITGSHSHHLDSNIYPVLLTLGPNDLPYPSVSFQPHCHLTWPPLCLWWTLTTSHKSLCTRSLQPSLPVTGLIFLKQHITPSCKLFSGFNWLMEKCPHFCSTNPLPPSAMFSYPFISLLTLWWTKLLCMWYCFFARNYTKLWGLCEKILNKWNAWPLTIHSLTGARSDKDIRVNNLINNIRYVYAFSHGYVRKGSFEKCSLQRWTITENLESQESHAVRT